MDYFRVLGLNREPFSNSPEPEFFFPTSQYEDCLQHLEFAIRLRRGLNVVIGEIGVGKSTLCRQLILRLSIQQEDRQQIETHLILDPAFGTPREFLSNVADLLGMPSFSAQETDWHVKEQIKNVLFQKGAEEKKIVVLFIDEGQKLPDFCLELLREFLNFETNEYKLLQIVIFTQPEFTKILKDHASFADRINHHGFLGPMTRKQTAEMIRHRLMKAANGTPPALFTRGALRDIYRATGGYPRKVVTLCHQMILAMITEQRAKADRSLVRSCLGKRFPARPPKPKWAMTATAAVLLTLFLSYFWIWGNLWPTRTGDGNIKPETLVIAPVSGVSLETAHMAAAPPPAPAPATVPAKAAVAPDRAGGASTEAAASAAVSNTTPQAVRPATGHPPAPAPAAVPAKTAVAPDRKGGTNPESIRSATAPNTVPQAALLTTTPPPATEPVAESTSAAAAPDTVPKMLGQLSMRKDGSVVRMIKKIYGNSDPNHLRAVARANPQIDNINIVMAGKTVHFPALPVKWTPPPNKGYRLQVARKNTLKEAYSLLEQYPPEFPAVQLIPYWNSREDLVFVVLLKERFSDEASAQGAKAQLPPTLASEAVIREQWDGKTVFFAQP